MESTDRSQIRRLYKYRTVADRAETAYRRALEAIRGVDLSIFDKTRRYYREALGQDVTPQEALQRALNKKAHKDMWGTQDRQTIDEIRHFYQEVHVYPFRQPYTQRFAAYRWLLTLVSHTPAPSVLEYGCGSAVMTEWLADRFRTPAYAVADIPSVTLEFVRWKQRVYGYPYEILEICAGRDGIPLRKGYDLIVCQDVLEHTPNPCEIVESFIEHLKPGGVLVVDFLNEPGGENLPAAADQREDTKKRLAAHLTAVKAIDEPTGNDGLYVKQR